MKKPSRKYGTLIDSLLDDAFRVLQHDTGETDPEWHYQRDQLAEKFKKTIRTVGKQSEPSDGKCLT